MNILFPEISVFLDEGFHHLNAVRILEETHSDALLSHDLFSEGREVDILSHQNSVKKSKKYSLKGWEETDVLIL